MVGGGGAGGKGGGGTEGGGGAGGRGGGDGGGCEGGGGCEVCSELSETAIKLFSVVCVPSWFASVFKTPLKISSTVLLSM